MPDIGIVMIDQSKPGFWKDFVLKELYVYARENKALIPNADEIAAQLALLDQGAKLEELLAVYLAEEEILEFKSRISGINMISLAERPVNVSAAKLVSEELARKYTLIPIAAQNQRIIIAMADPTDRTALDDVMLFTGYQVDPLLASAEEIKIAIRECFTLERSAGEHALLNSNESESWKIEENVNAQETPVVSLVDSLFRQAVIEKASDIHWEPIETGFSVKFRIDGLLMVKENLPKNLSRSVTARLKVMSGLDITQRRLPQDGRIMLDISDKKIDVRVSTFPTVYGEKVVTRILDKKTAGLSLEKLGMQEDIEYQIRKLIRQPHGLVLISGPTGSGKTTTLYALIRELQSETINIVSIEDPVEYRLPGVSQAQVNTGIGLDFASGLRSILRQDPDVIMVGEIRDRETAKIATAAAMTGHLVLSTVHTNTAAEALTRLLDMDIDAYMVASAVCGVLAQRLVRRLCLNCRKLRPVFAEEKQIFHREAVSAIYEPVGCSKCHGTGYNGRIGIHEYLPYNQEIKELILQKGSAASLEKASKKSGMLILKEDALRKVAAGITSLEEIMRLWAENND
ncbi:MULTISPECIES: GspE/PulE family protein [unclassified Dehalobacter]|uniref:GspE/PulE family protein n=1 Tax=unclassified Dehalobacter TaxID=2635733 RepID=UPI001FA971E5|nr:MULTISPECIES: GspE/PulE family protein [unclassified Dehalobacter]